MDIDIISVQHANDSKRVAKLADEIWRQHFTPIIGIEQVEYMLNKYQNVQSINSQIESGWQYYLFKVNEQDIAYTALIPEVKAKKIMIKK